ncbi:hypothetical protein ANCDUO_08342 [Ancylostoma duodenale]|uniref:Uncharacterized protein n=1 Tax=Ancylostoma duodenale TaxID=51022 RepID=A0A0C2GQM7_9BILA|nr:hypothetical protein ANCDUO_08342 [Ancylostoma duodenale]
MFVIKKWLKLRDTFVICLTIATLGISLVMIGLAYSSWLIYASLAPGSLHGLLNPLSYSFLSCLVEKTEGFVWLLMGGICAVAVAIYAFVHVVAKRENIGS